MNKVYIIIVNYNNYGDTIECLESVLKSDYESFQIFVVDNSTDSSSVDHLAEWANDNNYNSIQTAFKDLIFPLVPKPVSHIIVTGNEFAGKLYDDCIVIIKTQNRGFAAANNIVLTYLLKNASDSSLIWILNNDTVVEKDTLKNLASFYHLKSNNRYILGAKLRYYDKPYVLQAIAGNYNKWLGMHKHVGDGEKDSGQFDDYTPGKSNYIVGASIFLPKLFLEQTGLMCEDYFLYFEELDWLNRARKYGFAMAIASKAIVYHKEGASIITTENNKRKLFTAEYYSIVSRVRYIKKWYPYCLITVIPGVIVALLKRIIQGKFTLVKKATGAIFNNLFFS